MTPTSGLLASNVMHFARLLRRTGLPVGPAETIAATQALTHIEIGQRHAVQAALRAIMVHRHEHQEMFDTAFSLFWRNPDATKFAAALAAMDGMRAPDEERPPPGARRLAEAMAATKNQPPRAGEPPQTIDATLTFSESEKLNAMDFEAMSASDIIRAKAEIAKLRLPLDQHRTRRWRNLPTGRRIDLKATMRASMRTGGEILSLARRAPKIKPPPLVVLCDISGSMARYAQILLHFLHAVANEREQVSVFLFGTRLSNISRQLRQRDPEVAFQMIASLVPDWSGGTRIGEALASFNRNWARRVLGQGAVVLLVTDGLDRDGAHGLATNMERLHRSCRRLIWLNPLLRWEGFSPKTQGAKAMLPHVDEFRPVHNLASLQSLITSLSAPPTARGQAIHNWKDPA
ncbi:MAG: VWA domain-containing protein [Acidocella sp.]|nr:VWA domain-containing protein [Acidocella sp.]